MPPFEAPIIRRYDVTAKTPGETGILPVPVRRTGQTPVAPGRDASDPQGFTHCRIPAKLLA